MTQPIPDGRFIVVCVRSAVPMFGASARLPGSEASVPPWFHFTHWRQRETRWRFYVLVAATGILLFMAARELRGSHWRRIARAASRQPQGPSQPGSDSEFYAVEQFLARHWLPRPAAEPLTVWIARMPLPSGDWAFQLRRAVRLHYRLRFDPAGLSPEQRSELRTLTSGLVKGKGSAVFTRRTAGA